MFGCVRAASCLRFWDTANVYQAGNSEEVVGPVCNAILEQIDASFARLARDYVDLCQIHRFDPSTPARGREFKSRRPDQVMSDRHT